MAPTLAKSATTTNHITSDQRTLNALFWFYVTLSSWQRSILKNLSQFRCLLSPCCLVGLGLDWECVRGKSLENDATALQSSYMTHCWHNYCSNWMLTSQGTSSSHCQHIRAFESKTCTKIRNRVECASFAADADPETDHMMHTCVSHLAINKLAKLRRHAGRVHFAKIHFG